jgi:DNA-binding HxlR family transcriptional regulator
MAAKKPGERGGGERVGGERRVKNGPGPAEGSRSVCPVACALDIFGDRWTLLVIRDLALGRSHFKEFSASPEGIATNILADRLKKLRERGLVEAVASPLQKGREAYRLTERGRTLIPIVEAIARWGLEHIPGSEARLAAPGMFARTG